MEHKSITSASTAGVGWNGQRRRIPLPAMQDMLSLAVVMFLSMYEHNKDAFVVYMLSEDMRDRSPEALCFTDGWWSIVTVCHISVDDALNDAMHSIMEKFAVSVMCDAKTPILISVDEVMLNREANWSTVRKTLQVAQKAWNLLYKICRPNDKSTDFLAIDHPSVTSTSGNCVSTPLFEIDASVTKDFNFGIKNSNVKICATILCSQSDYQIFFAAYRPCNRVLMSKAKHRVQRLGQNSFDVLLVMNFGFGSCLEEMLSSKVLTQLTSKYVYYIED
jgi:hypothetical protein